MDTTVIQEEFQSRVSDQIRLEPEGVDRFAILTPFRFDDGDHYDIALKQEGGRWFITDEASTLMHLSYWMGTINPLINRAIGRKLSRMRFQCFPSRTERVNLLFLWWRANLGHGPILFYSSSHKSIGRFLPVPRASTVNLLGGFQAVYAGECATRAIDI